MRDQGPRSPPPRPASRVPHPALDLRAAARQEMLANGFLPDFPPEVNKEIAEIMSPLPSVRGAQVRDMRALLWSSIDNRESRDLDQLECAEEQSNGDIRVLVGVADVDTLVGKGSATDDHAARNTTSVYTGVAVFPMLPEELSTDLTSLNPDTDRLAVVVEMDVAPAGSIGRHEVYHAVVRNHAKLVYESVGEWLDGSAPAPAAVAASPALERQLRLQYEASQRLRNFRSRNGALVLETVEARAVTAGGKVIDIRVTEQGPARELIENFMVAANTATARFIAAQGQSSIRRVVRVPKRWDRIVELAAEMGETLPQSPDGVALAAYLARRRAADPESFPDLSLAVVKLLGPGSYILERRAVTRPGDGHFGLAVAEYAHSTAPNRRFSDLVTQRIVKSVLTGGNPPYRDAELEEIAKRCTEREDAARKVERAMRKRVAAVFMLDRIGDRFNAIVTGASNKGTYVRVLRPPIEGRVVRGERGLDIGDTVRLKLVRADPERGYIDFESDSTDLARKLERSKRKKIAAARLQGLLGESFDAIVTGASLKGTYVRLVASPVERVSSVEGRVVSGHKGLAAGQRVQVKLVGADPVHGFIDFEYTPGVDTRKIDRADRKKVLARQLAGRLGEEFDAVVAGTSPKTVYIRLEPPNADVIGRVVRGGRGLRGGESLKVVLLATDPKRGYIDFAESDRM